MHVSDLPRPKLVIFDCDGTLVDSEAVSNLATCDACAAEGLVMDPAETEALFLGLTLDDCVAIVEKRLGRKLRPGFIADLQDDTFRRLEKTVEEIPGATTLVQAVKTAGIPVCVASNGEKAKMDVTLGRTGMMPLFNGDIYSAVDDPVAQGKPAPDLFLYAAEKMGIAPKDCLVLEDSSTGVDAAKAAGMTVIGYRHPADIEITDLSQLIPAVQAW